MYSRALFTPNIVQVVSEGNLDETGLPRAVVVTMIIIFND